MGLQSRIHLRREEFNKVFSSERVPTFGEGKLLSANFCHSPTDVNSSAGRLWPINISHPYNSKTLDCLSPQISLDVAMHN